MTGVARVFVAAAVTVGAATPATAHAALTGCVAPVVRVSTRATLWRAPLDRPVALAARELSLRAALDLLAERGGFRLSYAAELLPLDRRVCLALDPPRAAGDVLAALIGGAAVEPVAVGEGHVVLAPRAVGVSNDAVPNGVPDSGDAPPETAREISRLAPVLVRDTARDRVAADERAAVFSRDVVPGAALGAALGALGTSPSGDALGGALAAVPGMWRWAASPASLASRWGSLRGASAFGAESPTIYVDGVEVANPLLFTSLVPDAVARVTVTRGPQGAARFGASAAGGVVEIETRHDGTDGAPVFSLRSAAGPSQTALGASVLAQQHTLAARAGSATRSAGLAVLFGTIGDFVPNGSTRELAAHGDARLAGARGAVTLAARVASKSTGTAADALAAALGTAAGAAGAAGAATGALGISGKPLGTLSPLADSLGGGQRSRQYTVAATATLAGSARWSPEATLGVDGYRLSQGASVGALLRSAADSALDAARGGVDQLTARVRTVGRFGDDARGGPRATVTFGAEHLVARAATAADSTTRVSSALVAQGALAFRDALFVNGGLRLERDAGGRVAPTVAALPTLGAAVVRDLGPASLKLRAAYGRSVRAPNVGSVLGATWLARPIENESQTGAEVGADVSLGASSVQVTRFDQRASGLLQAVSLGTFGTVSSWRARRSGGSFTPRVTLANGGAVANRGWELRGLTRLGRLAVDGSVTAVDSRVTRVSPLAVGSALRVGDRMLDVPARTASLSLTYLADGWSLGGGASRASDWVGYDRLALATDLAALGTSETLGTGSAAIGGDALRAYWRDYTGATRLRASASRALVRGVALTLAGENLLGTRRGEPDALALVAGRTIALGVQATF